ncbi:MAG TPA: extracellular solute-binding protein [Acidimicrobiales bacterium]|nr:extracellular solute-binding protein [Acidimicrobiales bacterium]
MSRSTRKPTSGRRVARVVALCVVLGIGGAMVALANPVSASPRPQVAPRTVTLQFWNAYNTTDTEASTMANIVIPKFESENPGITVVSDVIPYGDLLGDYLTAVAAGDPPDVMRSDIAWVPELAADGTLLNVGKQSWYKSTVKGALPGPLLTTEYKGQFYALPLDTNTQALFWNKALFAAAHITKPPTTLAQMFTDAKKLTVKSKGQFGLGVDGTDIWNVAPYIWSEGGSFTNLSYTRATGFMDSAATETAVSALYSLLKEGVIGSDFRGGSGAVSGEEGFPKDEYAMYIDGPWAVATYNGDSPPFHDYGISLFPSGPAGSLSTVGGEDAIIPAGGHHIADAVKFARFLESPFSQLEMAKAGQMSTFETDATAEVKAVPYDAIFTQQLKTAVVRAVTQYYAKMDSIFSSELEEIIDGKISVDAGLLDAALASNLALHGK